MNARTAKEIRSIWPVWALALISAAGAGLSADQLGPLWGYAYWFSLLLLSVAIFGTEFSNGTMTLLLSQPIDRVQLWREKMWVLGLAMGSAVLVFALAVAARMGWPFYHEILGPGPSLMDTHARQVKSLRDPDTWMLVGLAISVAPICALGGGLGLTLLLRHPHGAFWLSIALPAGLLVGVVALVNYFVPGREPFWIPVFTLVAYGVAGYWIGRRQFLKMQDADPLTREVTVGAERIFSARLFRWGGAVGALVRKELLLQQTNLLFASINLLCLPIAAWLASRPSHSTAEEMFLLLVVLMAVLLIPLLIGAASIAEERRMGLLEWQQALPPSRRDQWRVKLAVGALLVLVFSGLVATLLAQFPSGKSFAPAWALLPFSLGVFGLGFWASSVARNLLQALVIALAAGVPLFLFVRLTHWGNDVPELFLWFVLITLWVVGRTYSNYRANASPLTQISKNAVRLGVVAGTIVVLWFAVTRRVWEPFILEPRPGPAVINAAGNSISLDFGLESMSLLGPDGAWRAWGFPDPLNPASNSTGWAQPTLVTVQPRWTAVSSGINHGLAIAPPGSLWSWGLSGSGQLGTGVESKGSRIQLLQRIGHDTNWAAVAKGQQHSLALKQDGTLWAWGGNSRGQLGVADIKETSTPRPVGHDNDWISIGALLNGSVAVKTNGTLWLWGERDFERAGRLLEPAQASPSTNWARVMTSCEVNSFGAEKTDGTLWWNLQVQPNSLPETEQDAGLVRLDFGFRPRALAVVQGNTGLVIKPDGSLWEWHWMIHEGIKLRRIGKRNDWLAVAAGQGTRSALTADGWLWAWGRPLLHRSAGALMAYPTRPQRVFKLNTAAH